MIPMHYIIDQQKEQYNRPTKDILQFKGDRLK